MRYFNKKQVFYYSLKNIFSHFERQNGGWCIWRFLAFYLILYKNFKKLLKTKNKGVINKMKAVMKLFVVFLFFVLSLGFFVTSKSYAEYPPNYRVEKVYMDGKWMNIVYNQDGGIVEIIIITND